MLGKEANILIVTDMSRLSRDTSEKVRRTFNMKRGQGKFIGSEAPYGYRKDPLDKNALLIDEEVAGIVREIYNMYVTEGLSKRGIMMRLNSQGVLCPTEYKRQHGSNYQNPQTAGKKNLQWAEITITTILRNQMYLGHMVQGKQRVKSYKVKQREHMGPDDWFIVENTHEPVIDKKTLMRLRSSSAGIQKPRRRSQPSICSPAF